MGSSQDIMHTFTGREIASNFSQSDGWAVAQSRTFSGYNQMFVIERFVRGTKETVKLGVTFDRSVPQGLIDLVAASMTGDTSFSSAKLRYEMIVPRNTDISTVPASWRVHYMNAFAFEGNSLVWQKKPVTKPKEEAVATTGGR
jgi:hypothetical protein